MRVYIGPYVNRIISRVHDRYMNKKYGYTWDDNNTRFEHFLEKVENALQWVYNHTINLYLDKKQRKVKIKIHDYDAWSADHTLALVILPVLKKVQESKHGAPYVDDDDVPEHLRSTAARELTDEEKNTGHPDDNHFKRWDYVLGEMIFAFEKLADPDWQGEFYSGEVDWKFEKDEETGLSQMKYGPNHTFKVDREGVKKVQVRIDNGLRLFGRYYQALWT